MRRSPTPDLPLYGAIEAGGTKHVCAIGTAPDRLLARTRFATSDPETTLGQAIAFLEEASVQHGPLRALGVASFGPVDLDRASPRWGHVTSTPKPGWQNVDVAGTLTSALGIPIGFDTDVAGAALGEHRWGAGRGVENLVYVTVGTGIGGGILTDGKPVHGLIHPEMGHMLLPRHPEDEGFEGHCPFHGGRCLEGLASGPAIEARWKRPGFEIEPDHPAWNIEAHYLGLLAANLALTVSPQRLIFGGGVMKVPGLIERVRAAMLDALGGYLQHTDLLEGLETYLVSPALGDLAGVAGGLVLAEWAAEAS